MQKYVHKEVEVGGRGDWGYLSTGFVGYEGSKICKTLILQY